MTEPEIDTLIAVERAEIGPHEEDGQNEGSCLKYQQATGNGPGDSWCASLQIWSILKALGGRCPLPRTGSCESLRQYALAKGWVTDLPDKGCLGLVIDPVTKRAHHIFLVTDHPDEFGYPTIEGNTNVDGSSDGKGTYARRRGGPADTNTYEYIDLTEAA